MATILGINRTSNASFCLLEGGRIEVFARKERLVRKKHAWGRLGDLPTYLAAIGRSLDRLDAVVECYSSDPQRQDLARYQAELDAFVGHLRPAKWEISHHFSHALTSFLTSGFKEAVVLVIDNRGSPSRLIGETPEVIHGPATGPVETISAFVGQGRTLHRIGHQLWDEAGVSMAGLGAFYTAMTELVLGRENAEGILMGLAAQSVQPLRLPPLEVRGIEVHVPTEWFALLQQRARFSFFRTGQGRFSECADLAAATQAAFENALLEVAAYLAEKTGLKQLVYAGGCALNCAANGRLAESALFQRVFIPPACDDGGTAIGCALFGAQSLGQDPIDLDWRNDYLGPQPRLDEGTIAAMVAARGYKVERPDNLAGTVAAALADGQVVALYQGRSEAGPRALGHRSILADPRYPRMRDYINAQVKKRAWFRPLAPVVPLDSAAKFFHLEEPSPFMLRKVAVREEWCRRLGAVTHVDGSARVQTVTVDTNPVLVDILKAFGSLTGIPVLLNTSLNGPDEPIVEGITDILDAYAAMALDLLVIPPFVMTKHARSAHPLRG